MTQTLQRLKDNLRALPREAWILFLGTFINKFGAFVMPFLSLYLTDNGFDESHAAQALMIYGLGHVAASMVGGHLADTIGRRKTIALSMASVSVAMLLLGMARTFPEI